VHTKIILFSTLFFGVSVQASPDIEYWTTSKGTDVYYVHAPELPMVDIQVLFDAGSTRDGDSLGIAMLTNSLLADGANGEDADMISNGFESLGAIYASDVGYDSASLQLRSLTENDLLTKAIKNFKKVISLPDFPEDALERKRSQMLIAIKAKEQSPAAIAKDTFMSAIYQSHPYGQPSDGNEVSIKAITRKDVVSFYNKFYTAKNSMIAIVGAIDRKSAEEISEDIVNALQDGEKVSLLSKVKDLDDSKNIFIEYPSTQTHILVGQPGVKRGDADYFPLYVGNHILGGGGMVSRLFEEVREKRGLSYSVYSYFNPMLFKGPFIAGLQTKTDQSDEAISVVLENIKNYIELGPTEEELISAKKNIIGGFPLRADSNSKILNYLVVIGYYKLPLDYLRTFNANVEAVTIEHIKDAFKRRLTVDKLVTVKVGASTNNKNKDN
tara:strand:+ start:1197 stop:2516 length:1320 start_codon:yes stop_codon:yes gene_type:complete